MRRPLDILCIVPRFGSISRGVERFSFELISRLDPERFRVTVLSAPHDLSIPGVRFLKGSMVRRERLAPLDRLARIWRVLRRVGFGGVADIEAWSLLRGFRHDWDRETFDLVLPFGGSWTYRFARSKFPSARILSCGHAGPVAVDLRNSDGFIALTPFDAERARHMSPELPIWVIPNGVNLVQFAPAPVHSGDGDGRVILCAAALSADKRHDLLFDAVLHLPETVTVLCVGDGPMRESLARHPLARAGRVRFTHVAFAEMPEIYRQVDAFSLPSPEEAFGLVFVEAMASGLPVVANDGPRQRFVVGNGGLLCNVFDPDVYARALADALGAAPSAAARAQAERFGWDIVMNQYEELFLSFGDRI